MSRDAPQQAKHGPCHSGVQKRRAGYRCEEHNREDSRVVDLQGAVHNRRPGRLADAAWRWTQSDGDGRPRVGKAWTIHFPAGSRIGRSFSLPRETDRTLGRLGLGCCSAVRIAATQGRYPRMGNLKRMGCVCCKGDGCGCWFLFVLSSVKEPSEVESRKWGKMAAAGRARQPLKAKVQVCVEAYMCPGKIYLVIRKVVASAGV